MIKDILTEDLILTDADAKDWRDAVRLCGELLVDQGKVNEAFIQTMIDVIETYGPYMILVEGVAFFHGKPGSDVKEACLSLVTFKHKIVFDDFENQEIDCAFGFGAVDSDSHMAMIMSLASLLQDTEFINLIRNHGSKAEIAAMLKKY
ncbi:PTS sugar transporter subunit IIA [Dielma fastidiosa]|uniref:PTS sugar transporter subunit IIA n=1 Tax=Dielma fastidiosa TaxID=1034346 RepID=UPI000ED7905C|nr:PTS sugar transporter subunit IIA [Dielma fastidiosa]HAH94450.1 hypothetical protein [Dielma fastidiosa]